MPYSRNSIDGTRVYFEDDGGGGVPVVFYGGLVDSVEAVRLSPIAQALPADQFRLVYVDHRGVGRSDKPHERAAYAMRLRVTDAVSVLDAISVQRAHFVGTRSQAAVPAVLAVLRQRTRPSPVHLPASEGVTSSPTRPPSAQASGPPVTSRSRHSPLPPPPRGPELREVDEPKLSLWTARVRSQPT
jgi:hypothetical protein